MLNYSGLTPYQIEYKHQLFGFGHMPAASDTDGKNAVDFDMSRNRAQSLKEI